MSYFGGKDFLASMCLAAVKTLEENIIHLEPKQAKNSSVQAEYVS